MTLVRWQWKEPEQAWEGPGESPPVSPATGSSGSLPSTLSSGWGHYMGGLQMLDLPH